MQKNIIIHIPHASLTCPSFFYQRLLISKSQFEHDNIFISDYMVDHFAPSNCDHIVQFEFSRLFCDVERFQDDQLETMSKYGMGVIYEKNHIGNVFVQLDNQYKEKVIQKYYQPHHTLLDDKVTNILKKYSKCYIIDLHSFSDQFVKQVFDKDNNPDICIGYDSAKSDFNLITNTIKHFENYGYCVKANDPYRGSIIPNKYYNCEKNVVYSIMIEINKRVYLRDNEFVDRQKFDRLKICMNHYYEWFDQYVTDKNNL